MAIKVEYMVGEAVDKSEFSKRMFILGQLVITEMRRLALDMGLKDTGAYVQGFFAKVQGDSLIIENRVSYAEHLEFGTFAYFDQYDEDTFPKTPDPKKKDLPDDLAKRFPKGMQPFSVFRRVLFNKVLMNMLIKRAFS